ncbi:hypothetical protein OG21DRAFT_1509425 [Imleria badia]|nr:hypothetical protein OG21DRAFT_1509425 [Imleria badia]
MMSSSGSCRTCGEKSFDWSWRGSDTRCIAFFSCPTGSFAFPIHAGGLYDTNDPGEKVSDFVISSYTPTLHALILPTGEDHVDVATTNLRVLAVPQPDTNGQVQLPGARREIVHLQCAVNALSSSPTIITHLQSTGTVEDVLAQMLQAYWVRFACHGVQDQLVPLDSGLILATGRRLELSDITQVSAGPRGKNRFAFLSACQTATGNPDLSEEAVHVAAGMLLAGYQSVIATIWLIGDIAPEVAQSVYEQLFDLGQ